MHRLLLALLITTLSLSIVSSPAGALEPRSRSTNLADATAPGTPTGGFHLSSIHDAVRWGLNTTTLLGLSLSFGLLANVSVPNGTVEPGQSYATSIGLQTSGDADLTLSALGFNQTIGIPALGPSAPIPLPGLNYTYLGIPFNVSVAFDSTIVANCTSVASAWGCPGGFSWASSGDRNFTLALPANLTTSSNRTVGATDLSLSVSMAFTAHGTVPFLGTITIPIRNLTLPGIPGNPSVVSDLVTIVPAPSVTTFTATPNPVVAGHVTNLSVQVQGGTLPIEFQFAGVPAGCNASNTSTFACEIAEMGNYTVTVTISDAQGVTARSSTTVVVLPPPSTPPPAHPLVTQNPGGSVSVDTQWVVLGALGGAVIAGLAVYLWTRRSPPA